MVSFQECVEAFDEAMRGGRREGDHCVSGGCCFYCDGDPVDIGGRQNTNKFKELALGRGFQGSSLQLNALFIELEQCDDRQPGLRDALRRRILQELLYHPDRAAAEARLQYIIAPQPKAHVHPPRYGTTLTTLPGWYRYYGAGVNRVQP